MRWMRMNKEEFLSMLSGELENLKQEYQIAMQGVYYFREVNLGSKECQEAEYQAKMVCQKINGLKALVTLPAYARIQAMSDTEIEEYKGSKVEELELKIREIKAREDQETAKLSQLKAEQAQLITQFGSLSGNERARAIYRGRQLSEEISRYGVNNQWGVFAQLKGEIEAVRKQQQQIKTMTSQEIKQQLSSEIKGNHYLARATEWAKEPISASTKLQASVAPNPEKALQMANLLAYYRRLDDEQRQVKGRIHWPGYVPKVLAKRLIYSNYYDSITGEVNNPEKLVEIVGEFEGSFEQAKASFEEQFTEQKLSKLVGKEYGIDSSEVDMDFLEQHTDKLNAGELGHLQSLVDQRNKLSKKTIKTRDTKREITMLNSQITQEQSKIYKEVIGWYESQSNELLGIRYGLQFYSLEELNNSLERCKEEIGDSERAITEVKERIQQAKAETEQEKQRYETMKTTVAQQIRTLGGKGHEETGIPYASERSGYNLDSIASASNQVYQAEVINRVQQEAKNQADIREAELKGITVEQLTNEKANTSNVANGSMTETAQEVSHGMKK